MQIRNVRNTIMNDTTCMECGKRKAVCYIELAGNKTGLCNTCRKDLLSGLIGFKIFKGQDIPETDEQNDDFEMESIVEPMAICNNCGRKAMFIGDWNYQKDTGKPVCPQCGEALIIPE